ncbi:MAG: cytochrome C [Nautiliaceae bacterium]
MKKLIIFISIFAFGYPNCNMCHNGRVAPKIDSMNASELKQKLLKIKKSNDINPKMAFIKNYSEKELEIMIKNFKEQK